jgi:hypothetical protein
LDPQKNLSCDALGNSAGEVRKGIAAPLEPSNAASLVSIEWKTANISYSRFQGASRSLKEDSQSSTNMKMHYLFFGFCLLLTSCDVKVNNPPGGGDTTVINPPAKEEKNTTIVNPPAEKKTETTTTVTGGGGAVEKKTEETK